MLNRIVETSLRFKALVLTGAAVLLIVGFWVLAHSPLDVFPEFIPPMVEINTEAPGMPTEGVEKLVTIPIERAINGAAGLQTLTSSSIPGLSVVHAIFQQGFDIYRARQMLAEDLAEVKLPAGVSTPVFLPLSGVSAQIMMVGLTSSRLSQVELRTLAQWTLRPRLLAVPGVASVTIYGSADEELQVTAAPDRLRLFGLGFDDVARAAGQASAFGGAGYLDLPNQRLSVEEDGTVQTARDMARTPVAIRQGRPLLLAQVADVRFGPGVPVGDCTINGQPGVELIISKQPFANTPQVSDAVDQALKSLRESLPKDVQMYPALFRQAGFIREAIGNLKKALLIGCLLVMAILALFLFEWRTAIISVIAIPLSLLGAILVIRAFGATMNTMTLGGLAIALGVVVDDGIIDVENIFRRLALNRQSAHPRPAVDVVLHASLEVRSAVVYASFIVSLVFLPVFTLGGISGAIFSPIGYTYIAAILVSLLVALTVTPVLCLLLLPKIAHAEERAPFVHWLVGHYKRWLEGALKHGRVVLVASGFLLIDTIAAFPFLGGEFLPDFREPNFVIHMVGLPGTSLAESVRMGELVAKRLLNVKGVESVAQQAGRAELSEDVSGTNYSELWLAINTQAAPYAKILSGVQEAVSHVPGFVFSIKQFLKERLDEILSGATAPIVIKIYGPDLGELHELAQKAAQAIAAIPGVAELAVEEEVEEPQLQIHIDRDQAAHFGLTPQAVVQAVRNAVTGQTAGEIYQGARIVGIVVRGPEELRHDPAPLRQLLIETPAGNRVPLSSMAEVRFGGAPNIINREKVSRRILVTCNVNGRDVASVTKAIEARLSQAMAFPLGYHAEFGGEYQAAQESRQRLFYMGALVLLAIYLLLYIDFRSFRLCTLMMLSVPFALLGGVAAVLLTGGNVSLGSMVGFVTLFGIAIRNGIMLISHCRHLQESEQVAFGRDLIMKGAQERLSPILMTALSAGLALMPLVLGGGKPGHEIEHPMAVVIVGGLVSSTLLNLFVLPALFERFGRIAKPQAAEGLRPNHLVVCLTLFAHYPASPWRAGIFR